MAAPAAVPQPQRCAYHGIPIAPAELLHEGFCDPPTRFNYKGKTFFKIHGAYFQSERQHEFNPMSYYQASYNNFIAHASNPANLHQIDAIGAMTAIDGVPLTECNTLTSTKFGMFCGDGIESKIRMKLFCAFGKLHNFMDEKKIKLRIRGGMALRLQLQDDPKSDFIKSASLIDMDGLVIVDPSVLPDSLTNFKETFMKLLVLSISSSIIPLNFELICNTARGDENTVKIKIKTTYGAEFELADISFKYSTDPVIQLYTNIHTERIQVYPKMLPCVWTFPSKNNLLKEYEYVLQKMHQNLEQLLQSREVDVQDDDPTPTLEEAKLIRNIQKFSIKSQLAARRFPRHGGKKKITKKRTMKGHMRMRGGSTTEQIGAAAQMRAFLPRNSTTRNALNYIVHHESNNMFHDMNYKHDRNAQLAINNAFRLINANASISQRTKKKMMIAKKKSARARSE